MTEGRQSVTVQEAARILGTTEGGIRKRIQRGSLEAEKGTDGRVYVRVDAVQTRQDKRQGSPGHQPSAVEEELRARVESLERQLEEANTRDRENRRLLAAALERMPELESLERSEETTGSSSESLGEDARSPESKDPRPWWRKILGG